MWSGGPKDGRDTASEELSVTDRDPDTQSNRTSAASWTERFGTIGVDWWATIVAGAITLLAVAGVLPKIPW